MNAHLIFTTSQVMDKWNREKDRLRGLEKLVEFIWYRNTVQSNAGIPRVAPAVVEEGDSDQRIVFERSVEDMGGGTH